jgi:segregation and condensation protein B
MTDKKSENAIEAILFAAGEAVPAGRLSLVLGIEEDEVFALAKTLADDYAFNRRGVRLLRMDDKLQLVSSPEFADDVIHALERRRPPKLTQTSLEVLAICAYFQPVTRAYVEQVRGVDSSYTMSLLLERGLIEKAGSLDAPGRPSIYRTTDLFLRTMGVSDLLELPKLPDVTSGEGMDRLNSVIEAIKAEEQDGQLSIEED